MAAELEPLGMNAGLTNPFPYPSTRPSLQAARTYPGFADMMSGSQCRVDGVDTPCSLAGGEATAQCPAGCRSLNLRTNRIEDYHAYADGYSGYMPQDAFYLGYGNWYTPSGDDSEGHELEQNRFDEHARNQQETVLEHETGHGKPPCPPTQEQLRRSPIVKRAIKEAFDKADKDAKDFPQIGWIEHGGWIVWNKRTNQLSILHKEPRTIFNSTSSEKYFDTSTRVWLNNPGAPPKGWEFVAAFHIHPDNYLDPDDVGDVPSANHLKAPGIVGLPNGDIVVYGSYNRGIVNGNLPPGCH